MHSFAYLRVSTSDQTTENQLLELRTAGYEPDAVYQDTISGKTNAADRPDFARMLDAISRTKRPKRLIVTKLDRLGRDAVDIQQTIRRLAELGCSVRVLQLGDLDLTSTAGKLVNSVLAAMAEMERDLLIERTKAGLARAKKAGTTLGRPRVTDDAKAAAIKALLAEDKSVSEIARQHGVSRQTVMRLREA